MITLLEQKLLFLEIQQEQRQRRLTLAVALSAALIFVLHDLIHAAGGVSRWISGAELLLSALLPVVALYLCRGGRIERAGLAVLAALTLKFIASTQFGDRLQTPLIVLGPAIPLLAFMMGLSQSAVAAALALTYNYFLLLSLTLLQHPEGYIYTPAGYEIAARAALLSATTALTTWCGWYFIGSNRQLMRIIRRDANTDHMTGLLNRRGMEVLMQGEVRRAKRSQSWFSVLMIDMDFLKRINDRHGHQYGDLCLFKVSQILKNTLNRPTDAASRHGGEDFLCILPDTNTLGARVVAEKIRRAVTALALKGRHEEAIELTVSIGTASLIVREDISNDSLIEAADAMLYRAKAAGKNRVVSKTLSPTRIIKAG